MAFTAGSVELAKANKLGNQLAHLFSSHGLSGAAGRTGALLIERYAKRLGFGITGITTGTSFPPFGSVLPSLNSGTEAALQNPRGTTQPNGVAISGVIEGQTVGIFIKKFVRTGADYRAVLYTGSLGTTLGPGGTSLTAILTASATLDTGDRINFGPVFGSDNFVTAVGRGFTLTSGVSKGVTLSAPYSGATLGTGTLFSVETIGINSFTGVAGSGQPAVAGTTSEVYSRNTFTHAGFTAAIYYTSPSGGSGTWVVS